MQADMVRPEAAAVVPRGHGDDAGAGDCGAYTDRRRPLDRLETQAVDDNLVSTPDIRRHRAGDDAPERGRERRIRARPKAFVLAADLGPRSRDSAGKWEDHIAALAANGRHGRLGRLERGARLGAKDDQVPARDPLDRPESLLAEKLAVHHRDPPVASAADLLGDLPAVAEVPQSATDHDR